MATSQAQPKVRPYWHVDAKWVCGLLFMAGLWVSLLLYCIRTLTSEKVAVPLATSVVATMFSRDGLDATNDLDEFKQKAADTPGDFVEPLPGVKISKVDLNSLPPRELRLKIFEQVVRPYYELGLDGVAKQSGGDVATQQKIKEQGFALGFVNKKTHHQIDLAFMYVLGLTLLPLLGLILFSHRFGRLVSPGLILLFVPLPGAIFFTVLASAGGGGKDGPLAAVDPVMLKQVAATLAQPYQWAVVAGLALLISAAIGKIVHHSLHRSTQEKS
jgi:hypothetical protein